MKTDRATVERLAADIDRVCGEEEISDTLLALLAEKEAAEQRADEYIRRTDPLLDDLEKLHDDNHELRTKLTAAEAARDASQVDAERFIWLCENVRINRTARLQPYAVVEIWLDDTTKFQVGPRDAVGMASLRTAIDAARKETGNVG